MRTPPTPSKPETVRLTIPVSAEVHGTFQRLAKASGMSTGRAMGEWLADTLDAAEFMTQKVEQARAAPRLVAKELHAYALGAAEMTGGFLRELQEKGRAERTPPSAPAPPSGRTARKTPPSNTGVTTAKRQDPRG